MKWPRSRWTQPGIAFLAASVLAFVVEAQVEKVKLAKYVREYPHDGQDGLGATMDGLWAGAMTFAGVFLVLLLLQFTLVKRPS